MTINIHILFESYEYTVLKAANFSVLLVLPRKHKKSLATVTRLCRLIQAIFIIIFCLFLEETHSIMASSYQLAIKSSKYFTVYEILDFHCL